MRQLLLISALMCIAASMGCSKGSGDATPAASVTGRDMTGSYVFNDIECFNASGTLTHSDTIGGGYTNTIVVTGNAFTETQTKGSTSIEQGTAVFGANSLRVTFNSVTASSGVPNTATITRTLVNGSAITPATRDDVYNTDTGLNVVWTYAYKVDGNTVSIESFVYSDGAGGMCYSVYVKQ